MCVDPTLVVGASAAAANLFSSHFAFQLILFIHVWFIFALLAPSRAAAAPPLHHRQARRRHIPAIGRLSNGNPNPLEGHVQKRRSGSFHAIENPLDSIPKHSEGSRSVSQSFSRGTGEATLLWIRIPVVRLVRNLGHTMDNSWLIASSRLLVSTYFLRAISSAFLRFLEQTDLRFFSPSTT